MIQELFPLTLYPLIYKKSTEINKEVNEKEYYMD